MKALVPRESASADAAPDLRMFEERLRRGMTTRKDVRTWLGEPSALAYGLDTAGERYADWIYSRPASSWQQSPHAIQALRVRFDDLGAVCAYSWSTEVDGV